MIERMAPRISELETLVGKPRKTSSLWETRCATGSLQLWTDSLGLVAALSGISEPCR